MRGNGIKNKLRLIKLLEIAYVFFKLGCLSFGGPAAHIAMMEAEIVTKRKWMDRQHFLDLVGATNLIPGPNSTEMTMHCGHERAGLAGLIIAGIAFITPAVCITLVVAWFYETYGKLPEVEKFTYGIQAAVLVIILNAAYQLGQKALKNNILWGIGIGVLLLSLLGVSEVLALFIGGISGLLIFSIINKEQSIYSISPLALSLPSLTSLIQSENLKIFWIFLKIGAILYGGGMVLFAYLEDSLVSEGLLSEQQLIDAVAVGQFTPGPILSTASFIGYQINGIGGALAATIGIFLPSFILVFLLNPWIPKMRSSKLFSYFLDSVNVAAIALIVGVLITMGQHTLLHWQSIVIFIIALAVQFTFKNVNAMYLVILGALGGYLLSYF